MDYTSWDRNKRGAPILLAEDGPRELGSFTEDSATVDGDTWELTFDRETGAQAVLADERLFRAVGNFRKDKTINAILGEHKFTLINESANNWIIDDEHGDKVGQFSGGNNGVRRAILELDGDVSLSAEELVALSWFVRLILENRLSRTSTTLIGTLIGMSVVAILAFLF
ncbi:hypothetical protein [Corynebacterium alimapuense]|uniref:Uncharacterized protein n=1 Tax=Corynebacterium alimapuense TaxID=1576874 RepID=A0A3M8KAU2_9CORY|nr:hypothetical protein [Corynebacterium alimapuense]RNE49578.1 hypothetical protein C5L39_04325 [Corynebacterium alimapuense]